MIIDQWRELLTGQKTTQRVWLHQQQSVCCDTDGVKLVKHALSGRSKYRQGGTFAAVAPGRFPAIMVYDWHQVAYPGIPASCAPAVMAREVYAGGQWYEQIPYESFITDEDEPPKWDFAPTKGGNLSPEQLIHNGFRRVAVTIKDLYEADVRRMSESQLLREGYSDFLSFAQIWCSRTDRKISRRLANIASRVGIPAAERERLTRHFLDSRPDEFYRCAVLEISL